MSKKLIWIIVALVVLIGALIGLKKAGIIGKEEGTKVTTEKAIKRNIIETVNASGKVYPEVEVKVSPDISGEITDLFVNEGDTVKKVRSSQEFMRISILHSAIRWQPA